MIACSVAFFSPILKHENENAVWNIPPHSNGFPARPIEFAQCSAAGPRNFEDVGVYQSCSALSGLGRECVWRALLDYQELMGQRMGRGAELFMFHLNTLAPHVSHTLLLILMAMPCTSGIHLCSNTHRWLHVAGRVFSHGERQG
jgi:hypothetical protein